MTAGATDAKSRILMVVFLAVGAAAQARFGGTLEQCVADHRLAGAKPVVCKQLVLYTSSVKDRTGFSVTAGFRLTGKPTTPAQEKERILAPGTDNVYIADGCVIMCYTFEAGKAATPELVKKLLLENSGGAQWKANAMLGGRYDCPVIGSDLHAWQKENRLMIGSYFGLDALSTEIKARSTATQAIK